MLSATNIYVQYGDRVLLDRVNLVVGDRDRIGLVGRNGAGKSTFLKIISGNLNPDEGAIARPSASTLGYLHQEMSLPKGKTVIEEALTAFDETKRLEERLEVVHHEVATRTDYESDIYMDLLNEMSDLEHRFHILGGTNMEADAEKVLKGLGFKNSDFERLTDEFSGGWQMRIELAKMLLQKPDYLLLDEPTNHLDIESIIWLEEFLKSYEGAVITISHDKMFLDNVTNRTVEIELGKIYDYKVAYSRYVDMRDERREKMQSAYDNQQRNLAQMERTIKRFMAKATKTAMAQSMQKRMNKIDRIEIDEEDTAVMNIRFPQPPRSGQVALEGKHLTKKYGDLTVLNSVELKVDRGERIAFVGQNGQGKTTLAKIIVSELQATSGDLKLGHNVAVGYYAQNQAEKLQLNITLLETMENHSPPEMRTKLRAILGAFLFSGEDQDKKVSVLSGGERARLALACLLLRPINLLVLDEPTNHLDMLSKEVLKAAIMDYSGTLIVVSHDRDFLAGLTDTTMEFRDKKLHTYLGDVNYFLEKRKLDDMRQVELSTAAQAAKPAANGKEISHEERKQQQKIAQQAEKKVQQLEGKIKTLEGKMASNDFYKQADSNEILRQHAQAQKELEAAMEEWMSCEV